MARGRAPAGRQAARGQSVVEFALILPLIILLLFGALDVGRAIFAYNTLAQAAREGNRVAIVNQTDADVKGRAVSAAVTLGLTHTDIDVCYKTSTSTQRNCSSPSVDDCPQSGRDIGCLAVVTARMTYRPMTPVIGQIWSSVTLSSTSVGPIEAVCPEVGVSCFWATTPAVTPSP